MKLPHDPIMLFGVINMHLRDHYASLDALCDDLGLVREDIIATLAEAGFEYNPNANKFW